MTTPTSEQQLFGIHFAPESELTLADLITDPARKDAPGLQLVVTANLDHLVNLRRNNRFKDAYASAWRTTIDGAPLALWARLRGKRIPRVPGADLFPHVMARLEAAHHRPFFIVPDMTCADSLTEILTQKGFQPDAFGFYCPPFGFERSESDTAALKAAIEGFAPTHMFFGVGAPKSEIWLAENAAGQAGCVAMCIGAAIEFYTGHSVRAPQWMRRFGLEWLWRVAGNPKRLMRRYFIDSWSVLPVLWADLRGRSVLTHRPQATKAP